MSDQLQMFHIYIKRPKREMMTRLRIVSQFLRFLQKIKVPVSHGRHAILDFYIKKSIIFLFFNINFFVF